MVRELVDHRTHPLSVDTRKAHSVCLVTHVSHTPVEQILFETVRCSSDRVRARTPDTFSKLFKQHRNWRKYVVALERRTRALVDELQCARSACDTLAADKAQTERTLERVRERLDAHKRNEADVSSQVTAWRAKMSKLKALVEAKERELKEQTQDADAVAAEFARYRRQQRAKGLQSLLLTPDATTRLLRLSRRDNDNDDNTDTRGNECSSVLRADNATLRNQLVRAESDSVVLFQAVDTACKRQGELPAVMQAEVQRIARRLKATAAS